jgi:hypothetical protein
MLHIKKTSKKIAYAILCLLLLTGCGKKASAQQVNLALNKSYTMSPQPNYTHCTDPGDSYQLTDGQTLGCDWTKKSTVGWMNYNQTIEIKIDLKQISQIESLKIHTIGGGFAKVQYPEAVVVQTSPDNKTYQPAGFYNELKFQKYDKTSREKQPKTITVDLNLKARFLKILVRATDRYFFTDEIEVIEQKDTGKIDTSSSTSIPLSDTEQLFDLIDQWNYMLQCLDKAQACINENKNIFTSEKIKPLLNKIEEIRNRLNSEKNAIFNQKEYINKIQLLRAEIFRNIYIKDLVLLAADPMKILFKTDFLVEPNAQQKPVNIFMWQKEYESAAFNIINCSDKPLKLSASISPLLETQTGKTFSSSDTFTLRSAVYIYAAQTGYIADALILQKDTPFTAQPGEVTQLWLTIHNPTLTAGNYKAAVTVINTQDKIHEPPQTLDINIEVSKLQMPDQLALNTCVWAYPEKIESTKDFLNEVAQDLKAHHINTYVIHTAFTPWPNKTTKNINFTKFDQILETNKYAKRFLLFLNFKQQWTRDYFGQWPSQTWKDNFSFWLKELVIHLRQKGLTYGQFALYPYDEQLGDDFYSIAKLIKSVDPKIQIYANSLGSNLSDFSRFQKIIDIWCLHERDSEINKIKELNTNNIWTYNEKGPGRANPPYQYYRLMGWRAFQRKQNGAGFWVYADELNYHSSWNDSIYPTSRYGVIYPYQTGPDNIQGEKIITSRRWEAWRDGVEDYQMLFQTLQLIKNDKSSISQEFIDSLVHKILSSSDNPQILYESKISLSKKLENILIQDK